MKPLRRSTFRFLIAAALILVSSACSAVRAQGLIQTMLEQVAKFEIALQGLKRGYGIAQQGLSAISNIKKGDFDLHTLFFNSLMEVSPAIKKYGKVTDILSMQLQILRGCTSAMQRYNTCGMFGAADLTYLAAVYDNLKALTLKDIDELTGIITDGTWQMSDDQRLSRIDQLYQDVQEKYVFLQQFSNWVSQEAVLLQREKSSLQHLGKLTPP